MNPQVHPLGRFRPLGLLALALAAAATLFPPAASAQLCDTYLAHAKAAALVPPSLSGASAVFWGEFDSCGPCPWESGPNFTIQVYEVTGFTGPPTAVRVHSGVDTENGPTLYEWPIPAESLSLPFQVTFSPGDCEAIVDTLLYVVLATAAHPEGEARGRIIYQQASPVESMSWGRVRMLFR